MVLTTEQIKSITRGIVRVLEVDGWLRLCRMNEAEEQYYLENKPHFYAKAQASANVRMAFQTNSTKLSFDYRNLPGSSRTFAWFDLYIDGAKVKQFGQEGEEMTGGSVQLELGEGEKRVELYFPWARRIDVANVALDDGATVVPIVRKRTMICYGDSITQGFDNLYPSQSYTSRLARMLDADEINKGVGGEKFSSLFLEHVDGITVDYITVAYGTNDWNKLTYEELLSNCRDFCKRLSDTYPQAEIFVISPIWRIDAEKTYEFGAPLREMYELVEKSCKGLPNATPINGYAFVPHMKDYYKDLRVHPNDSGSSHYAEGLYAEIVKHLTKRGLL